MTYEQTIRYAEGLTKNGGNVQRQEFVKVVIEALEKVKKSEETFEWCTDCKEYDQEKHCCHRFTKCIRNTVEELKTQSGWIPCSERMPEENEGVLLTVKDEGTSSPYTWVTADKMMSGEFLKCDLYNVKPLAWMPLPEPYKESDNK